jgi:tRNA(fMet)-specific endonuclease VapC
VYCFDTDILSAVLRRQPPLLLIRRLAVTPPSQQFTTAVTYGEMTYGAAKRKSAALADRIRALLHHAVTIVPFDAAAAERYGHLRAALESDGMPLAEPDLRIAAIALSRSFTLVTANTRHFNRIPDLLVENWLRADVKE